MKKTFIASGLALLLLDGMLVNCHAQCVGGAAYPKQIDSKYILPYQVGKTFSVGQGNCRTDAEDSHNGNQQYAYDFDMDIGKTIIASRAGTVFKIEKQYLDGNGIAGQENYIIIKHGDGTFAGYYHLTKDGVPDNLKEGKHVDQGQVIAYSGNTGDSTSSHLHFEVLNCEESSDLNCPLPNSNAPTIPITFKNSEPKHEGALNEYVGTLAKNQCASPPYLTGCYTAEPFHSPTAINSLLLSPNN